MKHIANLALSIFTVFVVNMLLASIAAFYGNPKASVMVGPKLALDGKNYLPIDIVNFKDKSIGGLRFSIPRETKIGEIIVTTPIEIIESNNDVNTDLVKRIDLSKIEASRLTRIFVPLINDTSADLVKLLNGEEKEVRVVTTENLENPIIRAMREALLIAVCITLFEGIGLFYLIKSERKLRDEFMEVKKEMSDVRDRHSKSRLLLIARISDYAKELDFWRDTIRKMLYKTKSEGGKDAAETLIKSISESLDTCSTLSDVSHINQTLRVTRLLLEKLGTEGK